jgi:hypothetical protein
MRTKTRIRKAGATPTTLERIALEQGKAAAALVAQHEGDGSIPDGKFPDWRENQTAFHAALTRSHDRYMERFPAGYSLLGASLRAFTAAVAPQSQRPRRTYSSLSEAWNRSGAGPEAKMTNNQLQERTPMTDDTTEQMTPAAAIQYGNDQQVVAGVAQIVQSELHNDRVKRELDHSKAVMARISRTRPGLDGNEASVAAAKQFVHDILKEDLAKLGYDRGALDKATHDDVGATHLRHRAEGHAVKSAETFLTEAMDNYDQ